ncbi:MAG: YraN family protein [Verrucomicrobiota bacterium]
MRPFVSYWKRRNDPKFRRGRLGERSAARHLRKQGLKVLLRNVKVGGGELDLVCRDQETLVFVEVKARQKDAWERPATAVDQRKRRLIIRAADAYLAELMNPEINVRFDIVEVRLDEDDVFNVNWIPSAFDGKGN